MSRPAADVSTPASADPTTGATAAAGSGALDARYGRTTRHRTRDRLLMILGAVGVAVVVVVWVIWAGLDGSTPQIQAKDLSHTLLPDERAVEVTWQLSVPAGNDTACIVKALNEEFTVVGWVVVEIPASDKPIRNFTETVRTAMLANTGLVDHCWLT